MSLLCVENLSKSFGDCELFSNIAFRVEPGDRVALVGVNGSGKTTLLRILTGEETADEGEVIISRTAAIGFMRQMTEAGDLSAFDDVMQVFEPLINMENRLESVRRELELNADPKLIERQAVLLEEFEKSGGMTFRSRAKTTLLGLGILETELTLPMRKLSGGQQSKVRLARLLLSGADLLLLDEPTNHLDIKSSQWLEEYLLSYKGALIVVSHDRYFIDRICNRTFEIDCGRMHAEQCNYSRYVLLKAERQAAERRAYDNLSKEISRVEESVVKLKSFNREKSIKAAESREKQIDRMREQLVTPDSAPQTFSFRFKCRRQSGAVAISAERLTARYESRTLFENVSFDIQRGERIFIIGPNGCGKTTLLRQLVDADDNVKHGHNIDLAYYDQNLDFLESDRNVLDEAWSSDTDMTQLEVRSALALFMFRGDDVFKQVGSLSGGEKSRLSLVKVMLSGANMLIMDEPTNHLDIYMRETLEAALSDYPGTLLVVSHDRYLINKLADKVWSLSAGGLEKFDGNYDYYLSRRTVNEPVSENREMGEGGKKYLEKKARDSAIRSVQGKIAKCERQIEELESEKQTLQSELECDETAANYQYVLDLTEKLHSLEQQEDNLLTEWGELHARLGELDP